MNILAHLFPRWWVDRQQQLAIARRYDAAVSNHQRRVPTDTRSGNAQLDAAGDKPRRWARHLDENVPLISGLLTALALRASAVTVEPQVRTTADELADELNGRLAELWSRQLDHLEITGLYCEAELRQLLARSWLRDGDVFGLPSEADRSVDYGGPVPFGVQAVESDYLPFDSRAPGVHGVEVNRYGRPIRYHFRAQHPGDGLYAVSRDELHAVDARDVLHLARRDRLHQVRGVSCLASVITTVDDLHDMEQSERIAARMAAAACAAITRAPGLAAGSSDTDTKGDEDSMMIEAGMIFDDLLPGDSISMVNPTRPNPNAIPWRKMQGQAIAAGADASASTILRDYSGTYSSQRQELVEHHYLVRERLVAPFVSRMWKPLYERFVSAAFRHGVIPARQLRGINVATLRSAEWVARGVPWIDMLKEVQAEQAAVAAGFKSRPQVIRERGGNPLAVTAEIEADPFTPASSTSTPAQPADDELPDDTGAAANA